MSPKYTTPQWLHPRPRRLARLRIPGSHPKTNIVTHQTMEDLPVTFVGNDEGIYSFNNTWFCSSHVFLAGRKKSREILPFQKSQIRIFLDDAQTVRSIWAFGRQLRPLESTRCMAYMARAAWRVRGFPFPIIWIIWWLIRMNNQWIWTNWDIYTSKIFKF